MQRRVVFKRFFIGLKLWNHNIRKKTGTFLCSRCLFEIYLQKIPFYIIKITNADRFLSCVPYYNLI